MTEGALAAYVPRSLRAWPDEAGHRSVHGTLVSADISGFTALSERLADLGRRGAEELTELLNVVFAGMLAAVDRHDGDVLAFGGDAILVLFTGEGHTVRAAAAGLEMQQVVTRPVRSPTAGDVELGMSVGAHVGDHHLFVVPTTFRALVVAGPDASTCVHTEGAAEQGEVLLSPAAAAAVPAAWLGPAREDGAPLAVDVPTVLSAVAAGDAAARAGPAAVPTDDADRDAGYLPPALAEQVRAGPVHGEHRRVAVGFLEFLGTDDLLAAGRGDEVHELLSAVGHELAVACQVTGAHVLATDLYPGGGKFIVAAGAPTSSGDDPAALLRTLRHVVDHDPGLRLRAGANMGPVYLGILGGPTRRALTVMGDAVNLAARLMQAAEAGQLLASEAILAASTTSFATQPLPPLRVKGKSRPVAAAAVGEVLRSAAIVTDEGTTDVMGREDELAHLLAMVRPGAPSHAVTLVAEPGMGMSRLVDAVHAASPREVHRVAADRFEQAVSYALVRRLMRAVLDVPDDADGAEAGAILTDAVQRLAPELVPWLPLIAVPVGAEVPPTPESDRIDARFRAARIEDHASRLLAVAAGPSLVVVEDLDMADAASRRLVRSLASRAVLDHAPDADQRAEPVVVASATELPDDMPGEVLHLEPLADEPLVRLVLDEVGDLADHHIQQVVASAGGNPLFAVEIARALLAGEHVPATVEDVVTARIDQLAAADRGLVRDAAVLGQDTAVEVVGEVLGAAAAAPERWRELAPVAVNDGRRLRFTHALFQRVAYEGLSWRRRTEVHARAADAFAQAGLPDAVVSWHELQGGLHERAWESARRAATRAAERSASSAATDLWLRALAAAEHLDDLDDEEVASAAESLGDAGELAARFDEAVAGLELARRRRADDVVASSRLLRKLATLQMRLGDYPAAEESAREAVHALAPLGDPAARVQLARAHNVLAAVAFRRGDYDASARSAGRAVVIAEDVDHLPALAHGLWLGDHAAFLAGRPSDRAPSERALELLTLLDDPVGQANVLNNLGVRAYYEGDWTEAIALYRRSRAARDRAGDVVGVATQLHNIAEVLADQGRFADALDDFGDARRMWAAAGFRLGDALASGSLGWTEGRLGDLDRGLARLARARALAAEIGAESLLRDLAVREADLLLRAGRGDRVLELLAGLSDTDPGVARLRALARAARGEPDVAHALEAAVELARGGTVVFDTGLALLAVADRHPDPAVARAALDEARATLAPLGVDVAAHRMPPG